MTTDLVNRTIAGYELLTNGFELAEGPGPWVEWDELVDHMAKYVPVGEAARAGRAVSGEPDYSQKVRRGARMKAYNSAWSICEPRYRSKNGNRNRRWERREVDGRCEVRFLSYPPKMRSYLKAQGLKI